MGRNALSWLLAAAAALGFTARATAEDAVLAELYGSGVHAFFAKDYQKAREDLSSAIDGGTKDPRAYYFRGMTNMRLGRDAAAKQDLKRGAELESADINQFYPVSRSLERVQGSARKVIERERTMARAAAHSRQQQRNLVRYEERRRAESAVLRQAESALSAADAEAVAASDAAGSAPEHEDATAAPPAAKTPPAVKTAPDTTAEAAPDAAAPDAAAPDATEAATDNVFDEATQPAADAEAPAAAVTPAVPAEKATVPEAETEKPATEPETPAADADNPFQEAPAAEKPAAAAPTAPKAAAPSEVPTSGAPTTPAAEPAKAAGTEDTKNPFVPDDTAKPASAKPAEKPAAGTDTAGDSIFGE